MAEYNRVDLVCRAGGNMHPGGQGIGRGILEQGSGDLHLGGMGRVNYDIDNQLVVCVLGCDRQRHIFVTLGAGSIGAGAGFDFGCDLVLFVSRRILQLLIRGMRELPYPQTISKSP